MRLAAIMFIAFACSGAFASQPGQPLDCSDWVFLKPGLSCATAIPRGHCEGSFPGSANYVCFAGQSSVVDNESRLITLERGPSTSCPGGLISAGEVIQIVGYVGGAREILAQLASRCVNSGMADRVTFGTYAQAGGGFTFDAAGGRILLPVSTFCADYSSGTCPADYDGDGTPDPNSGQDSIEKKQLMEISGFATLFDVLQSFTPQPVLGFRVPYMPEGLPAADHFDTYWGNLAHPIDFTQAHPLQCSYPAAAPHAGDYLTVADTVPTPVPGQGVYYITSATFQGATRYGRKTTAGHLSGRDPAVLPVCAP